ncbi:MAG: hypothetical protein ABIJ04_00965 [Bacteroidota bacterium]
MKTKIIMAIITLFSVFALPSCKKDIKGCTNPNATNYDAKATEDDGSCQLPDPCVTNQTGKVYFKNNSVSNSTYDVFWDGAKIATVAPNNQSQTFIVSANVQHTLLFKYTNTNNVACTQSTPTIPQCSTWWFDCSQ